MVALILREKRDVSMEIVQHSSYNHLSEKHQEPPIHHLIRIEKGTGAEMQPVAIVSGIATRDASRTDNFFPCPPESPRRLRRLGKKQLVPVSFSFVKLQINSSSFALY